MAVSTRQLRDEVLTFSLKPNQTLSQFTYAKFIDRCKDYLSCSPPYGDVLKNRWERRFLTLSIDGLIIYNCHTWHEVKGSEVIISKDVTYEDVNNWQIAIRCLQRYCLNLLLAPRRQDFHHIKFSTGFYQYNIAKNFKGAEKILEAMDYTFLGSDVAKQTFVKMHLKNPKNLATDDRRRKLADVFVDLVLFDLELSLLLGCIAECRSKYTFLDVWRGRMNTSGGINAVLCYLRDNPPATHGNYKPPPNTNYNPPPYNRPPANANYIPSADDINYNPPIYNKASANNKLANDVMEESYSERLDLNALPPPQPDLRENDEFGSVMPHINPSSDFDDDNQLIKDSTQLGYRNPPEVKSQAQPSHLQPVPDPTGYPPEVGNYKPPDWLLAVTSSSSGDVVTSSNEFGSTCADVKVPSASGIAQGHGNNARRLGSGLQHSTTQPPHMASNRVASGELHSLPSGNSTQCGTSSQMLSRQKSLPDDPSLTDDSEMMAATTTGATTNRDRLDVSGDNPVIASVPLGAHQLTPEGSQEPPQADSKFGKTNLNFLKYRSQHRKEFTDTLVQTGGAGSHSHSTSNYANTPFRGVSDNANMSAIGNTDLTSLRSKLERTKEEVEKMVVAGGADSNTDYYNISAVSHIQGNNVTLKTPPDKKPMALPRKTTAYSNTHSESSTSPSKRRYYQLWRCAKCETVNEVKDATCKCCKLAKGILADRSIFCDFCQLMIFIAPKAKFTDTCCPRCKVVYETTL